MDIFSFILGMIMEYIIIVAYLLFNKRENNI